MAINFQRKPFPPIQFQTEPKKYQQHFLTQFREKTIVKKVEAIALFSVENEVVYLYTFTGEKFSLLKKMEYIESVCDASKFYRINRQMLVSRAAVLSFEPYVNRKIILQLKIKPTVEAIVSRLKVTRFKEWLEE